MAAAPKFTLPKLAMPMLAPKPAVPSTVSGSN
jgi:hypothetical protein